MFEEKFVVMFLMLRTYILHLQIEVSEKVFSNHEICSSSSIKMLRQKPHRWGPPNMISFLKSLDVEELRFQIIDALGSTNSVKTLLELQSKVNFKPISENIWAQKLVFGTS